MALDVEPVVGNPSGTVRGRMYVFHGIRDWPSSFATTPPFSTLINGLVADGWQTVTVGELYDGSSQSDLSEAHFDGDATKGASFREDVVTLHEETVAYVNATYGAPAGGKEALLGISWGGLMIHLLASSGVTARGYITHVAASCPPYMTEFLGDDLTELYPSPLTLPAAGPVWISYSTSDTRVGYLDTYGCENTKTIADTWDGDNPDVTIRGTPSADVHYNAQGHTLDSTNIADIRAFALTIPAWTYTEGYGNTTSAGYGDATTETASGALLVLPESSAWEQVDTAITVRTVDAPSTVEATITGTSGGLLRFSGTDAAQFDASLDGTTWASAVDVPPGTSTVHLRVRPTGPATTLTAQVGVPT